jgi:hypothetical protein
MSRLILVASAGWDEDPQTPDEAAARPAAGPRNRINGTAIRTAATAAVHTRLIFTWRILSRAAHENAGRPYLHGESSRSCRPGPLSPSLIGPWAKIADEIRRWKQTVLTTFSLHCHPSQLDEIADLVRS